MITNRCSRVATAIAASMLLITACGGGSDDSSPPTDVADAPAAVTTDAPESTEVDAGGTPEVTVATPETTEADDTSGSIGDFEPGDVEFRVINALDEPVDIYVRTSGLVEAFTVAEGVEPGAVTDLVAPPDTGSFVVTTAGAGDATCVVDCDHFIADLTAFANDGPIHTVVLYTDDDDGKAYSFDLWEQPPLGRDDFANAMPPADPASGMVVVTAVALIDAQFGLNLAVDGTPGCLQPPNRENVLVGGNQTLPYTYAGDTVDYVLHDSGDRECVEARVGGPFTVNGGPGTRSHLILIGSPGNMDAIIVPMIEAA